jgi:hypothetical protein
MPRLSALVTACALALPGCLVKVDVNVPESAFSPEPPPGIAVTQSLPVPDHASNTPAYPRVRKCWQDNVAGMIRCE